MSRHRHPVVWALFILLLVAITAFALAWRQEAFRAEQRRNLCLQDQRQYDTTVALIAESAKPGPQGSAIDHLVIPPDTPPSVIEILRQLNTSQNPPDPKELDRFYHVLGARPKC